MSLHSGKPIPDNRRKYDVRLLQVTTARRIILDWQPVVNRILTTRFRFRLRTITVVQCYTLAEISVILEKDTFSGQSHTV